MRVVLATGQLAATVAAQPFGDTALTLLHLLERERVAAIADEARELRLVERVAFAFHEPARLADERRDYLDRAGLLPTREAAHDQGLRLLAAFQRAGFTQDTPA